MNRMLVLRASEIEAPQLNVNLFFVLIWFFWILITWMVFGHAFINDHSARHIKSAVHYRTGACHWLSQRVFVFWSHEWIIISSSSNYKKFIVSLHLNFIPDKNLCSRQSKWFWTDAYDCIELYSMHWMACYFINYTNKLNPKHTHRHTPHELINAYGRNDKKMRDRNTNNNQNWKKS